MKTLLMLVTLLLATTSFAQELPTCPMDDENSETVTALVTPCIADATTASYLVLEMMLGNHKGMQKLRTLGDNGMTFDIFSEDLLQVTLLETNDGEADNSRTVIKYELFLSDCRGTDSCGDSIVWTVIETNVGDGYSSQSTYTNEFKKRDM